MVLQFAHSVPPVGRLGAMAVCLFLSPSAVFAQFHAQMNPDGDTLVIDTNGAEVEIAPADPVGVRPDYCPSTAYYVFEVQTDKTELVLSDCATGLHQYTVDMQAPALPPPLEN